MRPVSLLLAATGLTFLCLTSGAPAQVDVSPAADTQTNREGFDPNSENPTKCVTRDDIQYGEKPGIDPATGRVCRPVTADVIERIGAYKGGDRPKKIESGDPTFLVFAPAKQSSGFTKTKMARLSFLT